MSDRIFQEAYNRVRGRYTEDAWLSLNPRQLTDSIYKEIRLIDAERLRARQTPDVDAENPDTDPPSPAAGPD
jgi:hypothetical protein